MHNKITEIFLKYGFADSLCDEAVINLFSFFTKRLKEENEKYNLTAITETEEIITKHYIDSLSVLKFFKFDSNKKIIDIGTGAGFPSLPLIFSGLDAQFTLVDSSNKKIKFVDETIRWTETMQTVKKNNIAVCERAEILSRNTEFRSGYDYVISRAVSRLNVLIELCIPFLKTGGYFIAYKGRNGGEELNEIKKESFNKLGCKFVDVIHFNINDPNLKALSSSDKNIDRTFIVIQKTLETPQIYARNYNVILKSPL